MRLIHQPARVWPGRRVCLALGFFDGLHLGHQAIIAEAAGLARRDNAAVVVVTFDRHPNTIVAPGRVPDLIYPLGKRIETIGSLGTPAPGDGPDALLLLRFDQTLREKKADAFIRDLADGFGGIRAVCVGKQFVFGHGRGGNVAVLEQLGQQYGFEVRGLEPVTLEGEPISSTRIREAIKTGSLEQAGRMLGREYALCGTVVRGDGIGRGLGYPTANVDVTGLAVPPRGVYAVEALSEGKRRPGVVNIGVRPTISGARPELRVEAHLLDFQGDLYGKTLELCFRKQLRAEMKFPGKEELQAQIGKDVETARRVLTGP